MTSWVMNNDMKTLSQSLSLMPMSFDHSINIIITLFLTDSHDCSSESQLKPSMLRIATPHKHHLCC